MRYILIGLFLGLFLGLLPFWMPEGGIELYGEWHGALDKLEETEISKDRLLGEMTLVPIVDKNSIFIISGNGKMKARIDSPESLNAISGSGKYYIKYQKVGKHIELLDIDGDRFWKIKSMEYPFLSYNGKVILLLNGDNSRVRIIDYHGNEVGVKTISGRLCTTLSFSKHTDFSGVGFLDGSHYILNERGALIYSFSKPGNNSIKGIAISRNGAFAAVHYGNRDGDTVKLIDLHDKSSERIPLAHVHRAKTAIHVRSDGTVAILDHDRILVCDSDGDTRYEIKIQPKRIGYSKLYESDGMYIASYTRESGEAVFLMFQEDGNVYFHKEFPSESFLDCHLKGRVILLRGNRNLYSYSLSSLRSQKSL